MRRLVAVAVSVVLAVLIGASPASAAKCSASDTEKVRALLVPVTRISAHLGANLKENAEVRSAIGQIVKTTKSKKMKKALRHLDQLIKDGESEIGSTEIWGYHEDTIWARYKVALQLTQKNSC